MPRLRVASLSRIPTARPRPGVLRSISLILLAALLLCPLAAPDTCRAQKNMQGQTMMQGQGMMQGHGMGNHMGGMAGMGKDMSPRFIRDLAALGDRSAGSEGDRLTARMLSGALASMFSGPGWSGERAPIIGSQSFITPVQEHPTANIILPGGDVLPLWGLRQNALSPGAIPPTGIEGQVLYAGKGRLQDFNGLDPRGAVVLLDLDSGKNWQNAAMLGAQAVIYLMPHGDGGPAPRNLFEDKQELTPIDFPTLLAPRQRVESGTGPLTAPRRLGRATVRAKAFWEPQISENIWCLIPGASPELAQELLVVEAFRDSTALVPGMSPGADEGASLAAFMETARHFARKPPGRSVLLLATGAHAHSGAGMRHFVWAATADMDLLQERQELQAQRVDSSTTVISILEEPASLRRQRDFSRDEIDLLRNAFRSVIKNRVDEISSELMRLRLVDDPESGAEIKRLASLRRNLKQLIWVHGGGDTRPGEAELAVLDELTPQVLREQKAILADAHAQLQAAESALAIREQLDRFKLSTSVSLYLSSHGDGLGAFEKGWLYDLMPDVNRTRYFMPVSDLLQQAVDSSGNADFSEMFKDTLIPNRQRSWESYLPDRPQMNGEAMALAGMRGFTLATVHDARPAWGTPYDRPDRVNFDYLARQSRLAVHLISALAHQPLDDAGETFRSGFSTIVGRANLMRQGELFPDMPAADAVLLAFQWNTLYHAMVDTMGSIFIPGLADRKHSYHKAVIEGFRFDRDTGDAVWAIDKPATGKDAYRVKMRRAVMETELVFFHCRQMTMFHMLEPRTFKYMTRPELIDARTEAEPLRYWYSRLDTRSSSLGSFFVAPDTPLKLTLSDTVLGKKVVLLNASDEHPMGTGYLPSMYPLLDFTEYRAAEDMWHLLTPRVKNLEEKGIVNDRLRDMRLRGERQLEEARQYRRDLQWDRFLDSSRASLAVASQVYNDVEATQKDVLAGVLFYVALFVPFAYCMERLLFGFANIHKRIVGFLGLLLGIIGVVSMVHPAFELTYSPSVVILAFFILGLSLLVSLIIIFRFEREMVELQRRSKHFKVSDLSPIAAFSAAFALGVSNLRRRPVRTGLTLATLVILTFTIMNFTAVKSVRSSGWVQFDESSTYDGLMLKYFGWQDIPREALADLTNMVNDRGTASPRIWYQPKDITQENTSAPIIPLMRGGNEAQARGLVGLSPHEPQVSGMDRMLVAGRWFAPGETHAVLLPQSMAQRLGAIPGDNVTLWGISFLVTGVFADDGPENYPDLDGEPLTPIVYPSEQATKLSAAEAEAIEEGQDVVEYQSRYEHIPGAQTIYVPHETLLSMGGGAGRLKGIALSGLAGEGAETALGDRFGLMVFRGKDDGTYLFYTSNVTKYSGVANIFIPIAISVLIVLNTMIGSVYERKREIAVYTSVGLAPPHVSFLFVAEAIAFGVISVVLGYLLAQGAAAVLAGTPVWAGMTANYSSMAGVWAMLLVMAVVLTSVAYPSRVAASIAIPDVNRSWSMPEARGDELRVTLPFLIKLHEQTSAGGFLRDYYSAHLDVSHGLFCTGDMECAFESPEQVLEQFREGLETETFAEGTCFVMKLRVWLAPFDFGVRQNVHLVFCPSDVYKGFLQVKLILRREAGETKAWQNLNKPFINDLRKQLLVWRSLDEDAVRAYGEELVQSVPASASGAPARASGTPNAEAGAPAASGSPASGPGSSATGEGRKATGSDSQGGSDRDAERDADSDAGSENESDKEAGHGR